MEKKCFLLLCKQITTETATYFPGQDISPHSSGKETGEIFFKLTLVLPTPATPFRSNFEI